MITCAKDAFDGINVEQLAVFACKLAVKTAAGDGIKLADWAINWIGTLPYSPDRAMEALADAIATEMLVCYRTEDFKPSNETLLKRVLWL